VAENFKQGAASTVQAMLSTTPMLVSMYLLYWLEKNAIWIPQTLHRDKLSIIVVAVGMVLSFLIHSRIGTARQQ